MINQFEKWFHDLSEEQQGKLLQHILQKYLAQNEGYFAGPTKIMAKGLFTGPVSSQSKCPTCNRPY